MKQWQLFMEQIPVFIINLKRRTDRKDHILSQFYRRCEFRPLIVQATEHHNGAVGLWETIKKILANEEYADRNYTIICEDDHQFTDHYSIELLLASIREAEQKNADILCGGVSAFKNALAISENLFWVEHFSGMQFTVLFRHFFNIILAADFGDDDAADTRICTLTANKFFIYPFISTQKGFGYSDVTPKNNIQGRVETLFAHSMIKARSIKYVCQHYDIFNLGRAMESDGDGFDDITIPAYAVYDPDRPECLKRLREEFKGKGEFSFSAQAKARGSGDSGLLEALHRIIHTALINGEDVVAICHESHEFTEHYSRDFLLRNILQAYCQGADILSGGDEEFDIAVPVDNNRFWINKLSEIQFLILFKSVFKKILDTSLDGQVPAARVISSMTGQKMMLFPFISTRQPSRTTIPILTAEYRMRLVQRAFTTCQPANSGNVSSLSVHEVLDDRGSKK
jgi:hypothetical protein